MKKVLLSLLAVAALVLSCQNYDDEFAALNTKVASLESQISSLAGLQTALTQVQSSVSALQAAVSAIPNLSSEVAAIIDDLDALATAVAGATTSADLDALKAELDSTLADLLALIEENGDDIASVVATNADLKSQLEDLGVDVDAVLAANSTFEGNLTITNAAELAYAKSLGSKVGSIKGDVIIKVTEATATVTGNGVTAAELNPIISQITFVVGNIRIETNVSLDLSALTTVSGDYSIVGHDIDDSALASVGDDVYVDYDGAVSFPALATADKIYVKGTYVTKAATATAAAVIGTTTIDFMGLTKATSLSILNAGHTSGGAHTSGSSAVISDSGWPAGELYLSKSTTSVKINQAPITYVDGAGLTTLELHYAGDKGAAAKGLSTTGVAALGDLTIKAPKLTTGTVMAKQIGDITIDVVASTATTATGTVNFPEALYVGAIDSDALDHDFSKVVTTEGISLDNDVAVSLPALTTSAKGDISLPKATSFSAPKLAVVGQAKTTKLEEVRNDITVDLVEADVDLPALTLAGVVSFAKTSSFVAAKADVTSINIATGTTLEPTTVELLAVDNGGILDEATVGTVKLHGQDVTYTAAKFDLATSITIIGVQKTGAAAPNVTVGPTPANKELKSLTLGGALGTVVINMNAANSATATGSTTATDLASVVTSGTIESITVSNNFDLTTLTLGHTDSVTAETASEIVISNNHNLTSVTTSVKAISNLTVTNNGKLSTLNMSSIDMVPTNFDWGTDAINIDITGNFTDKASETYTTRYGADAVDESTTAPLSTYIGMTGTYTAESAVTSRAYGQSQLATLVPFFTILNDKTNAATGAENGTKITIDMNYVYEDATPEVVTQAFDVDGDNDNSTKEYAAVLDLE